MTTCAPQSSAMREQASYLRLLETVHHLRATGGPVELELLLPDDLFSGCEVLYGLPVRRVPGVSPGVVARLPGERVESAS